MNSSSASIDDPRVLAVVREFQTLLEAGKRPNRQEFIDRYPELADVLGGCCDALEFMHAAAPSLVADVKPLVREDELRPELPLGDFRLVREIGRGGMGVVYEAVQQSLGRRVAIKVLPFAATLDSRQLQRFKNESFAAAQLHHTNIVPVYAVGCDRGVHYYAMQFIEGRTLADRIAELSRDRTGAQLTATYVSNMQQTPPVAARTTIPTPCGSAHYRVAAEFGAQAADALEHAHQLGIVHRDIKPANLLLDVQGKLWVTDFGLAHCQMQAGLTMTGDLVGTLRYMSPEQAIAERTGVDSRTDIYSMGATLYEFLTLHPVFCGDDRQALLRQITLCSPRPPRMFDSRIPVDLEIIILKALEKNPVDRYASAAEFADDLRRHLRDEPIRAKRPTPLQRLRKWQRQHKGVVVSAAVSAVVILALAVIGLTIGNRFIAAEKSEKEAALRKAITNLQAADENFRQACDAVDRMLTRVAEERLRHEPRTVQLRRRLLEDARDFYEGFLRNRGTDTHVRHEASQVYMRLGRIYRRIGQPSDAEKAYRQGISLLEQLAEQFPSQPLYRSQLADALLDLTEALGFLGRRQEEEQSCRKVLGLVESLSTEFPGHVEYRIKSIRAQVYMAAACLSNANGQTATVVSQNALRVAENLTSEYPGDLECRMWLAACQHVLARSLQSTGHSTEAEGQQRHALRFFRERATATDGIPEDRSAFAVCLKELGEILIASEKLREAEVCLREALQIEQTLMVAFPGVHEYWKNHESISHRLVSLLVASGRGQEAENTYRHLLDVYGTLTAEFPGEPGYRLCLANFQQNLANLLFAGGRYDEGERSLLHARELLRALAVGTPDDSACKTSLFRCLAQMAGFQQNRGRDGEAEEALSQAFALIDDSIVELPQSLIDPVEISNALCSYAILLKDQGRLAKARQVLRHGRKIGVFEFATRDILTQQAIIAGARFSIARAAISVGCAPVDAAESVDATETSYWRQKALDCLRADLAHWIKALHSMEAHDRIEVRSQLRQASRHPDLAEVRDDAISKMPTSDQRAWRLFWEHVERALANDEPGVAK